MHDIDSNSDKTSEKCDFDFRVPIKTVVEDIKNLKITGPTKKAKGMFKEYYEYEITYNNKKVNRRFSDFDKLYKYLVKEYNKHFLPHLPPKDALSKVKGMASEEFLESRRRGLELFLKKLLTHTAIS
jgi:PX domain